MQQGSAKEYEWNTSIEVTDILLDYLTLQLLPFLEDWRGQMFVLVNYMYAAEAHQSEIMNDALIVRKMDLVI